MSSRDSSPGVAPLDVEWPLKADLRKDIYKPLPKIIPGAVNTDEMAGDMPTIQAKVVVDAFKNALLSNDVEKLVNCFYTEQAYWLDIVALTSHLRSFSRPSTISEALLHMKYLRGVVGNIELAGDAQFAVISPVMVTIFIDCGISFRTTSPALSCMGKMLLLPAKSNVAAGSTSWKIWAPLTWIENIVQHPEDETQLSYSSKNLDSLDTIETDVLIKGFTESAPVYQGRSNGTFASICCESGLNVIISTTISSSSFNTLEKKWTVKLKTIDGKPGKTITSKHFVQATGIGSQRPNLPTLENEHMFKGLNLHSVHFRNAQSLSEQGIKSVVIVGSANTAFDIMQDCHAAGIKTTMVARSPSPCLSRTLSSLGFPVLDSRDSSVDIQNILVERGGGHYVDVGGTDLIAEGKVAVRGRVGPIGYIETGLRLSDSSVLDTDAVIWCTGFADKDVRTIALEILGEADPDMTNKTDVLGPKDIVARLDATWGVDAEGEVRGVWKRHLRMENYWVMGDVIQQQRWWSRPMTQQIKSALEGHLPSAYRDTPEPNRIERARKASIEHL
ncbi:hypothetical protein F4813DRAFT_399170 [Daldinia decipiens]|uniref:uncharacterized protein n=1 Tax=Daldinia decipiens TaxID=326647 RepID=UPI0020C40E13|nr:uncharacterized protein F4813DRAFT_399170 [Daldinia decipiens]KAI1661103.1 hypothetical protein F4813DRAFT_399170 [Daldinia decipiens]